MSNSSGNQFLGLLAILFIGLKLGGVIDWSWWLVLGPLYIPFLVFMAGWALFSICVVTFASIELALGKKKR